MSFKTTMFLAAVLAGLGIAYFWSPAALDHSGVGVSFPSTPELTVARPLFDKQLGDIVKVVCKQEGKEDWVFEKGSDDSAQSGWHLKSPREMKVVSWEVDRIGRELGRIEYEISYAPGEAGGPSATEAGLEPPRAVVTLVDKEGTSVTVEIGESAPDNGTYVRRAGDDEVCVSLSSLRDLIKPTLLAYRDRLLWSFDADDLKRMEIDDRSDSSVAKTYVFVRGESGWMIESPVSARATAKVDDLARVVSRMRSTGWADDRRERLAAYGFDPPALTVRATVEEEIAVEEPEESAGDDTAPEKGDSEPGESQAEEKTETKVTVYTLQLSSRSPIGEETKIYMRIGDEDMVGTITKIVGDRFKPVMSEWRDLKVTAAKVSSATRIQLSTANGSATLEKRGGQWLFAEDESVAEESSVEELLGAIADLRAVAFVDSEDGGDVDFGLDNPRADVRLTIPGLEDVERIAIGGYTDQATKRLVYVRRNQVASIAKVRTSLVGPITRSVREYRNRTIVDITSNRVERITLTCENPVASAPSQVTFEKSEGAWAMTAPVAAPARGDDLAKLVASLADLRGERIVAEAGELSAYGLHSPKVRLVLTHRPPVEYRIELPGDDDKNDDEESESLVPVEVQPPSESIELIATEHDGRFYAKRADRSTIYEISADLHKQMLAEYRSDEVLAFDDSKVRSFSIQSADAEHVFIRSKDRWVYQPEPDLPLDSKKVENLLLQLKDLRAARYVVHTSGDLAAFGLDTPRSVRIFLEDGSERTLLLSDRICEGDPDRSHYAAVAGAPGVFLLPPEEVLRYHVKLDELEAGP